MACPLDTFAGVSGTRRMEEIDLSIRKQEHWAVMAKVTATSAGLANS